jgi:hypothetical protein
MIYQELTSPQKLNLMSVFSDITKLTPIKDVLPDTVTFEQIKVTIALLTVKFGGVATDVNQNTQVSKVSKLESGEGGRTLSSEPFAYICLQWKILADLCRLHAGTDILHGRDWSSTA